jgi:two-component system, NtrC family, sensor kinase
MSKLRAFMAVSFRAKVLVPVVGVMALLTAILMWMDSRRTVKQLQADAAAQLETADAVFNRWRHSREDELLTRYQILANAPQFKAVVSRPDPNTFHNFLDKLIDESFVNVNVIAVAMDQSQPFPPVTHDPHVDTAAFARSCEGAISQAVSGQPGVTLVRNGDSFFDVVAIPIRVADGSASAGVVGVVCFGVRNSIAPDFNQLTHSELVLVADGRIVSTSMVKPEWQSELMAKYNGLSAPRPGHDHNPISEITLGDEHFLCVAGQLNRQQNLGYLILSSYEQPLQTLHATQRTMLLLSALAILFGTAVVWIVVRKVTRPLSELRDSAEAVGRGDFSRRVEIRSEDECGELARVFNQMTENLKNSREQLEMTVETLKTTQAQLIQSEKLSGIGEFVAGVAHELNNPLTAVMGFSELLQRAEVNPKQRSYLETIHKSALRCQKIVQSLLSFARRHQPERKLVCVNSLVEAAMDILQYQMRTSNIEVVLRLQHDLPNAMVDPHQLQQVFLNLINNARQAMEAHRPDGGWLRITTEQCGRMVRLVFQDNGPGIPEENLSKVFDPFFTTKEVGKGTGLGLSLCYGIIHEHGGAIRVRSKPGEGATFIIELPLAADAPEPIGEPERAAPQPVDRRGGGAGRRVLVIDDEDSILRMVREALEPDGYEVDLACDGATALQQLKQKRYDLALCDWKMPGLNGREVFERIRVSNPAMSDRMIFITGDVINEKTRRFLDEHKKTCLSKPFSLADFRAAIDDALAQD